MTSTFLITPLLVAAVAFHSTPAVASNLRVAVDSSSGLRSIQSGPPSSTARMHYMLSMLKKFKSFALGSRRGVDDRHTAEEMRLQTALLQSNDANVKLAMNKTMESNKASLQETQKIYDNMVSFADALSGVLSAADSKGSACEATTCREHASCTDTMAGAQCVCNEGYVGNGDECREPPEFKPHRLLYEGTAGVKTQALDMNVCVFELNKIAVVFSDASKGLIGRIVLGTVREAGLADLYPPEQFTTPHGKAYNPVVQGSQDKRILVSWRDQSRGGTGWVRGATLGTTGIRGADMALTWGTPVTVAMNQAHKSALVSLGNNRFALMYADKVMATEHTPTESFGNSILAEVNGTGEVFQIGKFRFSDFALCRLEAAKVTGTSFLIAARASRMVDELDPSVSTAQEATAIYGELVDDELVFHPNAVNLEPSGSQIWARGISLIAPNTVAYAYQAANNGSKIKLGVVKIDPSTHRMEVVQQPVVIANGFSPYVSMLNVPYTPSDPHTLTYYEGATDSVVNVCSWSESTRTLSRCEDFKWHGTKLTSVSGVHLGGGKAFMVFSTSSGSPYYSVWGLSKK